MIKMQPNLNFSSNEPFNRVERPRANSLTKCCRSFAVLKLTVLPQMWLRRCRLGQGLRRHSESRSLHLLKRKLKCWFLISMFTSWRNYINIDVIYRVLCIIMFSLRGEIMSTEAICRAMGTVLEIDNGTAGTHQSNIRTTMLMALHLCLSNVIIA